MRERYRDGFPWSIQGVANVWWEWEERDKINSGFDEKDFDFIPSGSIL